MKMYRRIIPIFFVALTALLFPEISRAQHVFDADGNGVTLSHAAAVLEIISSDRGILPPRITEAARLELDIDSTGDGLLFFQTDGAIGFYLVQDGEWVFLNPILIPDDGSDAGDEDGIIHFARVAYTGDYNDLINKPNLDFLGVGDDGDTISFARVAYSGAYRDLYNKPIIPTSLKDISKVASSGNWKDLINVPSIPSKLREMIQDSLHQTISDEDRQRWNTMASRKIPVYSSDLTADEEYQTVSTTDEKKWNNASSRKIPYRLSDFPQNEFEQVVSDRDIERWENSATRVIPSNLRELAKDSMHSTITSTQKERWNAHANIKIPSYVGDFSTDDYFQYIPLKEREKWEAQANTPVPTKLSELRQDEFAQLVSDEDIARWDSAARRVMPTSLCEFTSDGLHRAVTTAQRELWEKHANTKIPSYVGDFSTDDYFQYITLKERDKWEAQANTPVPTRLSELTQDEFAQLVSDDDIARWNAATNRFIPSSLRDFEQDNFNQTVSAVQVNKWNTHASKKIPSYVGDFATDNYYQFITLAQKESWDKHASEKIPTKLSELTQDWDNRLATTNTIEKWDNAAAQSYFSGSYNDLRNKPYIKIYVEDYISDDNHTTVTQDEINKWNAKAASSPKTRLSDYAESINHSDVNHDMLRQFVTSAQKSEWDNAILMAFDKLSEAASTDNFLKLKNVPQYAEVVYTGKWHDLQGVDSFKYNFISSNSYKDLVNKPDFEGEDLKFWRTAEYNDLKGIPDYKAVAYKETSLWGNLTGRPKTLDDLIEDIKSVKVNSASIAKYNDLYSYVNGTCTWCGASGTSDFYGAWGMESNSNSTMNRSASIKNNLILSGYPTMPASPLPSTLPTPDDESDDNYRILTLRNLLDLDNMVYEKVTTNAKEMFPVFTVLPYDGTSLPNNCWEWFEPLKGKFPVGATDLEPTSTSGGNGGYVKTSHIKEDYTWRKTGGKATVTIDESTMPTHTHTVKVGNYGQPSNGYNASPYRNYEGRKFLDYTSDAASTNATGTAGSNNSHNNLPPYYTVNFIRKTKTGCGY